MTQTNDTEVETEDNEYVVPPVVRTVLERDDDPDRTGLGRSVLSVINKLEMFEWPISGLSTTLVHVSDEFRKADSKKKPGQEAPEFLRGSLKTPAHEERFWWVRGVFPALRLGLLAGWKEGVTPKGGRSFGFLSAHCADPVGFPTELFASYELGANDLKQKKEEPDWAHQERVSRLLAEAEARDRRYNLGTDYLNRTPMFKAYKEFDLWLGEAIDMTSRITQRKEAA